MRNPFKRKKVKYVNTVKMVDSTSKEFVTTEAPSVHGDLMAFKQRDPLRGQVFITCLPIRDIKQTTTIEVEL